MTDMNSATATVVNIAQSLLAIEQATGAITPQVISDKVDVASGIVPSAGEAAIDKKAAIAELIRRFSLWIGQDTALSDSVGHEAWLGASRKKDWRYWPRYEQMIGKEMSSIAVEAVDKSTDRILGLMEDPKRPGAWDRRTDRIGDDRSRLEHHAGRHEQYRIASSDFGQKWQ